MYSPDILLKARVILVSCFPFPVFRRALIRNANAPSAFLCGFGLMRFPVDTVFADGKGGVNRGVRCRFLFYHKKTLDARA